MDELIKNAQTAFASTFAFYLKSHNFHWNVVDENFYEAHLLFERIYDEVYDSIDPFAEKIRALNAKVPANFSSLKYLSVVEDQTGYPSKDSMVAELIADSEKLIAVLNTAYDSSEKARTRGFSNFMADRLDAHSKHLWMLRSQLPDVD
jgi:starvation-inducible DNA-binding protein